MMTKKRRIPAFVLGAVLTCVALGLLAGCGRTPSDLTDAEQAVQELLDLRAERSVDASAYAEFFLEPALAQELANASQMERDAEATSTPTPEWESPYLSAEESSTADVVVVWITDDAHPDWPVATVFKMQLFENRWVAADAVAIEGDTPVPAPLD